jgi:hypothetical protein
MAAFIFPTVKLSLRSGIFGCRLIFLPLIGSGVTASLGARAIDLQRKDR